MSDDDFDDDSITVEVPSTTFNNDPDDYHTLYNEWESLAGAWIDRGAEPHAIWAFLLSVVISVARENGLSLAEVLDICSRAWAKGEETLP